MKNITFPAFASAAMFLLCAPQGGVRAQNTIFNLTTGSSYATFNAVLSDAGANGAVIYFTADQALTGAAGTYLGKTNTVFTGSDNRITLTTAPTARLFVRLEGNKTVTFENIDITYGGGADANPSGGAISLYNEVAGGSAYILGSYGIRGFGVTGNGGALQSSVSGFVLGTEGGQVVFSGNRAGQLAGAIRGVNITFNADAVITSNSAGTNASAANATGGALWSTNSITFWGSCTLSGNKLVQSTLASSNNYGGAIYLDATNGRLLFDKTAVLTENINMNGHGGAVFARGGVQAEADLFAASNTAALTTSAGAYGGAFYVQGDFTVKGAVTATGNYAQNRGGALYLLGSGTINGGSTFSDNTAAAGGGGAIYWAGGNNNTLTLSANTGDIVFHGNTANGEANAIHLGNTSAGITNTLDLSAAGGRALLFFDPISSSGIVAGAANIITLSGAGEVLFDSHRSSVTVSTTVNPGATMRLANDAIYGVNTSNGGLTLAGGARLVGNGAVESGTITIQPGALIEVTGGGALAIKSSNPMSITDASIAGSGTLMSTSALNASLVNVGVIGGTVANSAQILTIAPGAALAIAAGGTIAMDMFGGVASDRLVTDSLVFASGVANINLSGQTGDYTIIQSANSTFTGANFNLLVNGFAPSARYEVTPDVSSYGAAGSQLDISFLRKNVAVAWTGDTSGIWQSSLAANDNWTDGAPANAERFFQNGDRVSFDGTAALKIISIAPEGVIVGDMTVAVNPGNDHTFTGEGGITSNTTATIASSTFAPSGKLVKTGGGMLTFANSGANTFAEGIELGGGKLAFSGSAQLGDGGKGIAVTASSTLAPSVNGMAFGNTITLAGAGVAFAIETASGATAVYNGKLAGAAGVVAKTGAGSLVLTNDSTAFGGTLSAGAGGLLLNAARVSTVVVAPQALFGGAGHADTAATAAGSTLQIGMPGTSGTLSIGALNLAADGILNYNILTGNQSSVLNVTALTGSGTNPGATTLNFNAWLSGTYSLGNVTALATGGITLNSMSLNVRQTYSLAGAGGALQLVINPTANGILVWDGTGAVSATDGQWNTTAENWFGADNAATRYAFTAYDSLVFDNRVSSSAWRAIDIPVTFVASAMAVGGSGTYTFTGAGGVTTGTTGVFGITADGGLTKTGEGTLSFANTGGNQFQAGIVIGATGTTGGVIEFTRAGQLAV
ncbi:MAG: hypothetical protein LBM92_07150, partial [Opitutaceae bacterium]|nr:hypothetical protein [Opitutaceae bacterium]